MLYLNSLEKELNQLQRELETAKLNGWDFDVECLKEEILNIENELNNAYEG